MLTAEEVKDFLNRYITEEEYQKLVKDYFQQTKDLENIEKDKDGKKIKKVSQWLTKLIFNFITSKNHNMDNYKMKINRYKQNRGLVNKPRSCPSS